jgi:hypothetical protein
MAHASTYSGSCDQYLPIPLAFPAKFLNSCALDSIRHQFLVNSSLIEAVGCLIVDPTLFWKAPVAER